jgi:hypothetical protein
MLLKELVGRRVKVVAWEHLGLRTNYLRRTQHTDRPEGPVTHVEAFVESEDDGDVGVQIDGLTRECVFGLYQLKVLPLAGATNHDRGSLEDAWPPLPRASLVALRMGEVTPGGTTANRLRL